jgi:hypothetical protein
VGLFDIILYNCPSCGAEMDEQYKPGDMNTFHLTEVPARIAAELGGWTRHCYACNAPYHIKTDVKVTVELKAGEAPDED